MTTKPEWIVISFLVGFVPIYIVLSVLDAWLEMSGFNDRLVERIVRLLERRLLK